MDLRVEYFLLLQFLIVQVIDILKLRHLNHLVFLAIENMKQVLVNKFFLIHLHHQLLK